MLIQMEQNNWIEVIPVSQLAKWEITQEVQKWIRNHHRQRLKKDPLYKELVKQVILLKDHYKEKQEVKDHIAALLRILSIQFEDEREDKDFDSGIRIILHSNAIQDILKLRTYSLSERLLAVMKSMEPNTQDSRKKTKEDPLPVTKEETYKPQEDLLQHTSFTEEPLVLSLPVKSTSTCWNSILTKQQKDNLIFIAKCGDCSCYHKFPKCDKHKSIRMQSGMCQSCRYIKKEEDYYISNCGNCF